MYKKLTQHKLLNRYGNLNGNRLDFRRSLVILLTKIPGFKLTDLTELTDNVTKTRLNIQGYQRAWLPC